MNKLKLYTDNKIIVAENLAWKGVKWGFSKLWPGFKYVGDKLAAPLAYVGVGSGVAYYATKDDPATNTQGLEQDEVDDVNVALQNTLTEFGVEYSSFYKDLYKKENIYSDIIEYSVEKQRGSGSDLSLINSKFMIGLDQFLDKFLEDNISSGNNPFGLSDNQAVVYNQNLISFIEKVRACSKTDLFAKKLDEQLNVKDGINDIMSDVNEKDPESLNQLRGQARVIDEEEPEDKEEDRMSAYEKNRLEAKKFLEELEEDRKRREAEMGLLDATRPSDTRLDGSRIADNLNWYIRLEQKIEDEGSGLFGMYNKFKKLPIFSFVRAQSRGGEFTKDSRQVKRRYSSILMSKSDSKYRTEIFEAPEYDIYPYYIKQRILILKFLKNELGSKFDSIYKQKMDEIESSNYADDGEFSIMPNKLAKALNKIIKKAGIDDLEAPSEEFKRLVQSKNISELKTLLSSQRKYDIGAGTIYKKYRKYWKNNSDVNYNNKLKIFFEALNVRELTYNQMYSCIVSMASKGHYDKSIDSGSNEAKLYKFFDNIHNALESIKESSFKEEETETNNEKGQGRHVGGGGNTEEPIDTIDENYNIMALRRAMATPDYVEESVRKTPQYSNLQNLGVVKIDEKYFVSKWNGSKEVFRYEQVKKDGEKYNLMTGGLYYYWVGNVKIRENGQETTKNVFMTNANVKNDKIEVIVESAMPGRASARTISGIFINTSEMLDAKSDGSDNKRTALESYRYGDETYSALTEKLKGLLEDETNMSIRYPLTKAGAVLVNGKPSTISETDSVVLNDEKVSVQTGYLFRADTRYTLTGGFSRAVSFATGKGWSLSSKAEKVDDFLGETNKHLAQESSGHLANPAILYYLNSQQTSLYLKHLALYGFASINQGYLISREEVDKMRARLSEELVKFYKKAKQSSSK